MKCRAILAVALGAIALLAYPGDTRAAERHTSITPNADNSGYVSAAVARCEANARRPV